MINRDTILHLCVKNNTLKVQLSVGDYLLFNPKNSDDGTIFTILHLTVANKQMESYFLMIQISFVFYVWFSSYSVPNVALGI